MRYAYKQYAHKAYTPFLVKLMNALIWAEHLFKGLPERSEPISFTGKLRPPKTYIRTYMSWPSLHKADVFLFFWCHCVSLQPPLFVSLIPFRKLTLQYERSVQAISFITFSFLTVSKKRYKNFSNDCDNFNLWIYMSFIMLFALHSPQNIVF